MAVLQKSIESRPHHAQEEICTTRAKYRQGRKLTAVKVYTINDESKHLLVQGVPSVGLKQEIEALFKKFGRVVQAEVLADYPSEQFCEAYLVKYDSIQSARIAKNKLDGRSFFGGSLHICYAPELETEQECSEKLAERRRAVEIQLRRLATQDPSDVDTKPNQYFHKATWEDKPRKSNTNQNASWNDASHTITTAPETTPLIGPQKPPNWSKPPESSETSNTSTPSCSSTGLLPKTLIPRQLMVKKIVFHSEETRQAEDSKPMPQVDLSSERKRRHLKTDKSVADAMIAIRRKVMQVAVPNPPVSLKRQKMS